MVLNLRLFQKTSDLENKVDSFFLKLAEAGVIYRLAVRNYLKEGFVVRSTKLILKRYAILKPVLILYEAKLN